MLCLTGRVGDVESGVILESQRTHDALDPIELGEQVAQDLIDQGASSIIAKYISHDQ
jgi:hypothetical protein